METWVSRNLRVKCRAEYGPLTDGDDCSIVERCQHLYLRANRFNYRSPDEECVEWRFS